MKSTLWFCLAVAVFFSLPPTRASGQQATAKSEVEQLKAVIETMKTQHDAQMRALLERLNRLEETQSSKVTPVVASVPVYAAQNGEKEITLPARPDIQTEPGSIFDAAGLPKPEIFGAR